MKTKTEKALMATLEMHLASMSLALHLLKHRVTPENRKAAISMLEQNLVSTRAELQKVQQQGSTTH